MYKRNKQEQQSISFKVLSHKNTKAALKFLRKGGTRSDFFSHSVSELLKIGFDKETLKLFKEDYNRIAEEERKLAQDNGIEIVFVNSDYFPPLLKEIYNPPEYLYVKGDIDVLKTMMIGVVGSRKGTEYGRRTIAKIIPDLVSENITIVSGMAYGIDSMSHKESIKNGGKTIGVNAGGLLHIYPSGNLSLINKIISNGCVVSELPLEMQPRPHLFPIRNRIIAGMSKSILVVEAEMRSGSLITARLALEQNRDIFSIPGRVDMPLCRGTNYLIQQGAKLITSSKDILIEYGIELKKIGKVNPKHLLPKEKIILDLMKENDVNSINYFVEKTENSVSEIVPVLMGMVLKNLIAEEEGGFVRII